MSSDDKIDETSKIITGAADSPGQELLGSLRNLKLCCHRQDYLEWNDFFMATAFLAAQRSKDPATQVGACIVSEDNKIVGVGYNGMPNGCDDKKFPWGKTGPKLDQKYLYVCHAEMNAVLNKITTGLFNCRIYVVLFPCNECAKIIIQSGIREVIYFSDKNANKDENVAAKRMFDAAGVHY